MNDVTMQMHQRIEALKQKAGRRISQERAIVAKLESELAVKDERLQAALALLEEYAVGHRVTFLGRGPICSGRAYCHQECVALQRPLSADIVEKVVLG